MQRVSPRGEWTLIANSYSMPLAKKVCAYLKAKNVTCVLESVVDKKFPDGSSFVKVGPSVMGNKVIVIHNHLVGQPEQTNYDLFLIADALKRANDEGVTLCPTYFVSRGDKRDEGRVPIAAKMYADLLQKAAGSKLERVTTVHLHAGQVQGFFDVPVDNIGTLPLFSWYIKNKLFKEIFSSGQQAKALAVLAPDKGSTVIAREAANHLGVPLSLRTKIRRDFEEEEGTVHTDSLEFSPSLRGRHVLIFDDLVDTGSTLIQASDDLVELHGAKSVWFFPSHLVMSKDKEGIPAEERMKNAKSKPKVVTTDTIQRSEEYLDQNSSWLHCVLSVAPLLGESIYRQINAMSIADLHKKPEEFESIIADCFRNNAASYLRENGAE
ncbi:hypothetical protein CMO91_00200 [Candidatus Woesearchaeota archaeon]|nr:hypothetical protein [Candidatus Woesearchaeota archaeon]